MGRFESPTEKQSSPSRFSRPWVVSGILLLLLGAVGGSLALLVCRFASGASASAATNAPPDGGEYELTRRGKFEIICREEGELRPVQVTAITFMRSGKISFLVPEGTYVKKGDKLCGLETKELDDEIKLIQDDLASNERNLTQLEQNQALETERLNNDLLTERDHAALARLKVDDVASHPLDTEREDAKNQLEGALAHLDAAKADLESDKILEAAGFSKRAELESKELAVSKAEVENERAITKAKVTLAGSLEYDRQKSILEREQAELELKLKEIDVADQIDTLEAKARSAKLAVSHSQRKLTRRTIELERSTLLAPHDGIIVYRVLEWLGNRKVEVGERVWQNMTPIELPNYQKMKVVTQVPESFIRKLVVRANSTVPGTGSKARVKINTQPDRSYNAEVVRIDGWARDRNEKLSDADVKAQGLSGVRVFTVEVEIDESDTQRLRDGFRTTVEFPVEVLDDIISVPTRAIRNHDGVPSVQVLEGGALQWRVVKPGVRSIDRVEVAAGLNENESVVVPLQPQKTEIKKAPEPENAAPEKAKGNRGGGGGDGMPKRSKPN